MRNRKKRPEFLQEIVEPEIKTPEAEDLEKEASVSSKKVEKHELQEIRNVGYF
jgi:hypothetical protein